MTVKPIDLDKIFESVLEELELLNATDDATNADVLHQYFPGVDWKELGQTFITLQDAAIMFLAKGEQFAFFDAFMVCMVAGAKLQQIIDKAEENK